MKGGMNILLLTVFIGIVMPVFALGADKLLIKNGAGTTTFKVEDNGSISSASRLLSNGASAWGRAPFVLGARQPATKRISISGGMSAEPTSMLRYLRFRKVWVTRT